MFGVAVLAALRLRRLLPLEKLLPGVLACAVCAGVLPALAGCRAGGGSRKADLPLEVLALAEPETLDPRYVTDPTGMRTSRLIHAGLVRLDPDDLSPVPYLAESWRWRDERTLEVTIRPGLRFHSGAPLRPEDVVATLRAVASPEVGSRHAGVVEAIESVAADGAHGVVVTLRRPHATLLTDLELPILRADQALSPPDPHGALDGLGPYTVARVAQGEVELAPAALPGVFSPRRAVVIRTVHDENARALRLLAGTADVAPNAISPTLLSALEGESNLSIASRPGANLTYIVARMGDRPTGDPRLRRAISLAIDRAGIAETLLAGHAEAAETLLPRGHWAHVEAPPPVFDPAAAARTVEEAGMQGVALSLLTSTDRLRVSIARYLAQQIGRAGVRVEVTPLELGTLLARLGAGDFDLAVLQLPELTEPNVLRVFLHSAFVPPAGANRGRVRDPELDRLLDLGDAVRGVDARRAVYADVERRLRDQLFIIPLWHEDQVVVTGPRARGFVPSREGRWLGLVDLP